MAKRHKGGSQETGKDFKENWNPYLAADGDSTRALGFDGAVATDDSEAEEVEECGEGWEEELEDKAFCDNMLRMSSKSAEKDDDWLPYRLRWIKKKRNEKRSAYLCTITVEYIVGISVNWSSE